MELNRGEVVIFWLGQNSYILKTPKETTFAIDPYLSRDEEHFYVHPKPPMKPEDLKADCVFCTHDHQDHTDPQALPVIAKHSPSTVFLGPRESCDHIVQLGVDENRVEVLTVETTYNLGDLKVTPYYSVPPEEADTTHFGYLFEVEGIKIYNMGDTHRSVVRSPETILHNVIEASPDIAMFPIIGDTPERRPEDAFRFAQVIKPKIVIPSHYGCFSDRTIDPQKFVELFGNVPNIKPVVIPYKGEYIYKAARKDT